MLASQCFIWPHLTHRVPPFDFKLPDRSRNRNMHRQLLNSLLDAISTHIDQLVGFVGAETSGKPEFEDAYPANFAKVVRHNLISALEARKLCDWSSPDARI